MRSAYFCLEKKLFDKNTSFKNGSENIFYRLQRYFVDMCNVFQARGYRLVTLKWSYDTSVEVYRRKTKSFHFLQKETPIQALLKGLKQPFLADYFFQMALEIFLWVIWERLRYLKCCFRSWLSSAHRIMTVRPANPFLLEKV